MSTPLWTDKYAPELGDLLQENLADHLRETTDDPINMVLYGPAGVGKTAAVRALARKAHENPDNDLIELNVADVFDMTKKELSEDPRFSSFIDSKRRRNSSKTDLINHVLKESASYSPMSGDYKTILLDNAEGIRDDFQQALRRVMEQHYETTQFIITTRQPSKLIPALKSRCLPLGVRSPSVDAITELLEEIAIQEDVQYKLDGLSYIAGYSDGNVREAILSAQTVAEDTGEISVETAHETLMDVGVREQITDMLDAAEAGDFGDARSILDDLLIDEGYAGSTILEEILAVAHAGRYEESELAAFVATASEVDVDLATGSSARIQLSQILADLGSPDTTI